MERVGSNISNKRKSVSSYFQTPKNEAQPSFLNHLRGVWELDGTLFQLFEIACHTFIILGEIQNKVHQIL